MIDLARSNEQDDTDDLIELALTKGKQAARLAIEAVAAERNRQQADEVTRIETRLLLIAWITGGAAILQAVALVLDLLSHQT